MNLSYPISLNLYFDLLDHQSLWLYEKIILYLQGLNNVSNDFKNVVLSLFKSVGKRRIATVTNSQLLLCILSIA